MENYQQTLVAKPETNLVWAILSTLLCCLPFGIVSIVYATKVDTLWFAGRYHEAFEASKSAKNWALAGAITGLVAVVIYFVIVTVTVIAVVEEVSDYTF